VAAEGAVREALGSRRAARHRAARRRVARRPAARLLVAAQGTQRLAGVHQVGVHPVDHPVQVSGFVPPNSDLKMKQ